MRNLKRALSLTLASVMLLGMMVVGAGAAGFPDVADDNDNVEAIEVLQAIEVMVGNADTGNFEPDRSVTRTEMAVVMANLLKLDYKYYEASCPFWDVPTWAKSYVGACYANKIVSGYGDGTYGALDPITPVQAASMMMRALGYFQYSEDYKDGFETATVRQGTQIGIFEGIGSSADKDMTRGQVARMALNALESEMVTFTGTPGSTYTASNGESITVGYVAEYTPRTSTELKYKAIEDRTSDASLDSNHRGQYYIQLGEELYNGKLTKKFERDEFERPSINWQYNGKEIGTYVDYELKIAEFRTGVTGAQMYDELTYTTINDNDLLTYVDGVDSDIQKGDLVRSNKNDLTGTGTGVLTEVFVDLSRDEVTITSINTWLAKANSDYNSTNDSLSLKVFTNRDKAAKVSSSTKIVDGAKIAKAEDLKKDEYVLVYMSGKDNTSVYNDYARFDVVKIFDAEILSDIGITKWSRSDTKVSGDFTADGTVYKTNTKAFYDGGNVLYDYNETLLTDMSYNVYLDRYGNAIGVDLHEGTKNYVFITGYDRVGSNISVKTADAAAIFLDGTMDVIKVNVKDTNKYIEKIEDTNANFVQWTDNRSGNGWLAENRWYTYTVNNSGVYTLKPAERMFWTDYTDAELGSDNAKILNSANLYVDDSRDDEAGTPSYTNLGRAYGNDDSIYITVEADSVDHSGNDGIDKDAITDVNGVYTGAQNVKLEVKRSNKEQVAEAYVYTVYDSSYYIIASIVLGDAQGTAANYAYILDGAKNERVEFESASAKAAGDATYYWEFDAVLNGEKQTLTAKSKYNSTILGLKKFHVQELRYDGDYVTNIVDVKADKVMDSNQTMEKIDKMDVYDVGHVAAVDAFGEKVHTGCTSHSGNAYGYSDHRLDGTIELVGRTLYTERVKGGNNKYDVGLALASDAKAVLVQVENGKTVSTQCSSVSEAIGRLADADTRNVPAAEGIQFQGRIVAVLKDGIAQWVVIISDTELRTNDKDYNSGTKSYLTWDKIDQEWDLKVPDSEWVANPTTTQIARWLERAGCSNVSKTRDGWNFTFEGYDYTNQYINVLEPVVADTYTVTVADAANGKVSVSPKDKLEKGTVVTISATGNTGYVVDKITVETEAGAPVTVTGNKFTMPAANVTVTVTFKADVTEGEEVAITVDEALTSDNSRVTVAGTVLADYAGAKGKVGDTIVIRPSTKVVDVTGVADGKITGPVTITVKEGFTWSKLNELWMGVNDEGNLVTEAIPAARMARAALRAANIPVGPIDIEKGWLGKISADTGATYTITIGPVTWTGVIGAEDGATVWKLTAGTVEQAKGAIAKIDEADVEKTEGGNEEPTDPAEMDELVREDGNAYTINYYTEAAKPTKAAIEKLIKDDQSAYSATYNANDNTVAVKYTKDGAATTFTVTLNAQTKVIYKGSVIGWVDKDPSNTIAVKGFAKGAVVICGDEGVKVGTAVSVTKSGEDYVITPAPAAYVDEDNQGQDDFYIYDAVKVTLNSVDYDGWKGITEEEYNALPNVDGSKNLGVVPGTELIVKGQDDDNAGTFELRVNGVNTSAARRITKAVATDTVEYGYVQITSSMVGTTGEYKGKLVLDEVGPLLTIKLDGKEYFEKATAALKVEGLTAGKSYITAEDTAAAAVTVNTFGKLQYTVNSTDADEGVITLREAYPLVLNADVDGGSSNTSCKAQVVKAGGKWEDAVDADAYVAAGATVYVWAAEEDTVLSSKTVTLKAEPAKDAVGEGDSVTHKCFSFTMPAKRVTDISAGASLAVTATVDPANKVTNLLTPEGQYVLEVVLTDGAGSAAAPTVAWANNAAGEGSNVPKNLTCKVEAVEGEENTWTITLTAGAAAGVPDGNYFCKVTVDGITVVVPVGVPKAPTATTENDTVGGKKGETLNMTVTATANNGGTLAYAWTVDGTSAVGANATLDAGTLEVGVHTAICTVTETKEGVALTTTVEFTAVVLPADLTEIANGVSDAVAGQPGTIDVTFDVAGLNLAVSLLDDDKGDLSVATYNAKTGKISYTLDANAGSETGKITVTISSAEEATIKAEYKITVTTA